MRRAAFRRDAAAARAGSSRNGEHRDPACGAAASSWKTTSRRTPCFFAEEEWERSRKSTSTSERKALTLWCACAAPAWVWVMGGVGLLGGTSSVACFFPAPPGRACLHAAQQRHWRRLRCAGCPPLLHAAGGAGGSAGGVLHAPTGRDDPLPSPTTTRHHLAAASGDPRGSIHHEAS